VKIPKTIKIGGHDISVSFDHKLVLMRGNSGESCAMENSIVIDPNAQPSQQEATLLHEIIENINSNYELKLEHTQISSLEATLYQVLHDNKLIF